MAAVAGAVADHVLAAMTAAAQLTRAYVNDGGDIALHLAPGESFACGMVAEVKDPRLNGRAVITAETPVRGIATSGRATLGQGGRSFSLGIADAVTVFARSAAAADVAATLIANAVDLPGHPGVRRQPAREIDPESDLGGRLVTTGVGPLSPEEIEAALARGLAAARAMQADGLIEAAVLFLRGEAEVVEGTTQRLSSRDLFPGPNARAVSDAVRSRDVVIAAGSDAFTARNRHAVTAMGPGNKCRDDSGVGGWDDSGVRVKPEHDGQKSLIRATTRLSSRGLSPGPIALAVQSVVEVLPVRIAALDQPNLPGARPLLHGFLPLDRAGDVLVNLDMHQTGDAISLDEAGAAALPMFPDPPGDIVGDADVEGAVLAAGEDVNVIGHRPALTPMGPGNPGNKRRDRQCRDDSDLYSRNETVLEDA
jgi:hypothetical protein